MNTINYNKYSLFCLALILLLLSGIKDADSQSNSPYSRFGIGILRNDVFSSYRASGNLGAAMANYNQINFSNPASYTNIHSVTFDLGVNFDGIVLNGGDSTYTSGEGSLSHISMGIPIKKNKWGMSFGILPYSYVNYSFIKYNQDDELGANNELFTGNGTTYQLYLGNALRFKNLTIGLNAIYMFGRLEYQKSITFPDSTQNLNVRNSDKLNLGDVAYNVGLQYDLPLVKQTIENQDKDKLVLSLGVSGRGPLKIGAKVNQLWETFKIDRISGSSFLGIRDTVLHVTDQKSHVRLPYSFAIGASLHNSPRKLIRKVEGIDWLVGTEFEYSSWSDFESPFENGLVDNSWKLSFGARVTPELSIREKNYLKKVDYGLGFYTGKNELILESQQFKEYGITFGVGLPVATARTYITLDIGIRDNGVSDLFKETTYKISASFTLSDSNWFIKRKFD